MTSNISPRQLLLGLRHSESFAREDFIPGVSNAAALALVDAWPDWPDRLMVLCGPEGAGKSHLASIWGERSGARFLSGRALGQADLFAALSTGALVLEDVSAASDEVALFHLINLVREERAFMLMTCRTPPVGWAVLGRDIASRLRALSVVTVNAPDDKLLRAIMVKLAADRQIALDDVVTRFLANRVERSFKGARAAVARLDQESLRQKRPITRALAAELFRDGAA